MIQSTHFAAVRRALLSTAAMALCLSHPAHGQDELIQYAQPQDDAAPSSQLAQDQVALAAANADLPEIIVTAQKRETDLQETPISITVMTADALEARNIKSLEDFFDGSVPSLRIAPFFSRTSALTVGIRGIVPFDANQPSRDATVGVYLGGIYLGRAQGLGAALYDVERIEVLKGPQGTLFGRNSVGGAVSIVTRKPSGEFALRQRFGVSNYDGYSTETHLDLPAVGDVSFKIDGIISKRGGTVENPLDGEPDFNSFNKRGLAVRGLWQVSDAFSADYTFDVAYDGTTPYYLQLVSLFPNAPRLAPLVQVQADRAETADIGVPQQESAGHFVGHRLQLTWTPSDTFELRSLSSYRRLKQSQFDNGGGHQRVFAPNATFSRYSLAEMHQDQYSTELQAVGSLPRLEYVGGLYYFREEGDDYAWTPNTLRWNATGTAYTRLGSLIEGQQTPFPDRLSDAVAKSFAAYGQFTYTPALLDDALHFTAGARYTRDRKRGRLLKSEGVDTPFSFTFGSSRVDPQFTLAYDVTEDVNVYTKWGTAYRAGGANARSLIYRAFGPEKVQTTELGFKSELWERRARFNVAAYHTRYKDRQIDFSAQTFVSGRNIGTLETVNTPGNGTIKGLEADLTVAPAEGLTLSLSYAYTETKFPQAPNPFLRNALTNTYAVFTPKNAVSGSIDYEVPLDWGTLVAHLDANHAGTYYGIVTDTTRAQTSFIVNGRLALTDIAVRSDATLEVSLWSRNLFDESYMYVGLANAGIGGITGIFNEPRTFGLDLTLKF